MFVFLNNTGFASAAEFVHRNVSEYRETSLPEVLTKLIAFRKTEALKLPTVNMTASPSPIGMGTALYSNTFETLGAGNGYIKDVAKVAKKYSCIVPEFSSLFLLPTILAKCRRDLLDFRDMLQHDIDGNFTAALWQRERFLVITTKPCVLGTYSGYSMVTDMDPRQLEGFRVSRIISPYTITVIDNNLISGYAERTIPWKGMSKYPLYVVVTELDVKRALKHSTFYPKENIAFLHPAGTAISPLLNNYKCVTTGRGGDSVFSLAMMAYDTAIKLNYDAVVMPSSTDAAVLRYMSDMISVEGARKNFNFLDINTHVVP